MPPQEESTPSERRRLVSGFIAADLSSPHLADLLDERIRFGDPAVLGVQAELSVQDLDAMPIERGIAIVERCGLALAIPAMVLDAVRAKFPTLRAQAMPALDGPRMVEIFVADDGSSWAEAGFDVNANVVRIGSLQIVLTGRGTSKGGIAGWRFTSRQSDNHSTNLDGIPTSWRPATKDSPPDQSLSTPLPTPLLTSLHPNGVIGLDHVVMTTPHMSRSIQTLENNGFELRRIREIPPNQQAFFWAGDTIIELVGPAAEPEDTSPDGQHQATLWGLAFSSADLGATADHLGDRLGPPKGAVQAGRTIATLRGREIGVSVPIVIMSDHPGRTQATANESSQPN